MQCRDVPDWREEYQLHKLVRRSHAGCHEEPGGDGAEEYRYDDIEKGARLEREYAVLPDPLSVEAADETRLSPSPRRAASRRSTCSATTTSPPPTRISS